MWYRNEPVWAMNYYGYILQPDLITPNQAGNVLKRALSQPHSQARLLDNLSMQEEQFDYAISSKGDVSHFVGKETISVGGKIAYALDYHGGQIKP